MICAIVWGEDESFGTLNNSLDMAGTGIVEHDVFLPEVEPGVEYQFVVQGTTADGTLYRGLCRLVLGDGPRVGSSVLGSNPFTRTIDEFTAHVAGIVAANPVLSGLVLALVGLVIWSRAGGGDGSTQSHQHAKQAPGDGPE